MDEDDNGLELNSKDKIEMLKELDMYCSELYSPYYTICEYLYICLEQLKQLYKNKKQNKRGILSDQELKCLEEAKQCHLKMYASCENFKYELASFHGSLYTLANLIDPNHDIDF